MQEPPLLQPDAPRTGVTPGKPTPASEAERLQVIDDIRAVVQDEFAKVLFTSLTFASRGNNKSVTQIHSTSYSTTMGTQEYLDAEDQALYRKLRKQGMKSGQAREALKLMGINPIVDPASPRWHIDPQERKKPKKELPHYFNRRRF